MGHKEDLKILDRVKKEIKDHPVVKRMFKDYKVPMVEIFLIPMCFKDDLEVSARTAHGCIYFNSSLRDNGFKDQEHYMVHEIFHYLDQCTGMTPTNGSEAGEYLDNPEEIEAFQNQLEFIHEKQGPKDAEKYVNRVVDHHDLKGKKREKKKEQLLDKCDD